MSRKRKIDPNYYETHDFGDEFEEAARNGTLIVSKPGESTVDALRRHMLAGKGSGSARPVAPLAAKAG
jgi:hypothetical protein